jgi:hypothetical protein
VNRRELKAHGGRFKETQMSSAEIAVPPVRDAREASLGQKKKK